MFVVGYVFKKNVCIVYSCFDFEQIPFPVQPNLCTWLACSFLCVRVFLEIQKTFSQHEFSGDESQREHSWKLFILSYRHSAGSDFCITAEAHGAVKVPYERETENCVLSLSVLVARYDCNASSVPAMLS